MPSVDGRHRRQGKLFTHNDLDRAKPAVEKAARTKLRWECDGERGKSPQQATASNGAPYRIDVDGDKWKATVTPAGGKAETLAEGVSINAAYARCVKRFRGEAEKGGAA